MLKAYIVPHPPLIVEGIGDGTEISATRSAYEQIGREVSEYAPDVTVIISPHSVLYADYFHISPGKTASGSFEQFRCPQVRFDVDYDAELAQEIARCAEIERIPAGFLGEKNKALDHGVMVPLYYTHSERIVRISLSGLGFSEQYRFGMCIRRAIDTLGRKAVIIASGDMSHKLGGSYGFSELGVIHDNYVRECIEQSDIRRLFAIDPVVAENAAECGLRSIMIMCGVFDCLEIKSDVLSYEAPYGVGYMTARLISGDKCDSVLPRIKADRSEKLRQIRAGEDDYVRLARKNVEYFTRTGKTMPIPDGLPTELLTKQAGVFVSIKKNGVLRGCIGTTGPTTANVAQEIIQNGKSACARDPRFEPVATDELDELTYSVDILLPSEPITGLTELDVKRYGVIVTSGDKRGLLLPNLDGVDTVEEQVRIALQKGGIRQDEKYTLERFEVVRHT